MDAATAAGAGIVLLIRTDAFAPECVAPWRMMMTFLFVSLARGAQQAARSGLRSSFLNQI